MLRVADPGKESIGLFGETTATSAERKMEMRGITATFDGTKAEVKPTLDWSDMRKALHSMVPRGQPVLCSIVRDSKMMGSASYTLYLGEIGERFLLSARKRSKKKTSNYVISLDPKKPERQGEGFFGKVRANFMGSEFVAYDDGVAPRKAGPGQEWRRELAAALYKTNILGTKGPRKMQVLIPGILPSGQVRIFRPETDKESLAERFKSGKTDDMIVLKNKAPMKDPVSGTWYLNFNGRVTKASVKNFQLVVDDDTADGPDSPIILQFGKTNKDTFTMDVSWPLSIFQAFAIVLSSFDSKLACE